MAVDADAVADAMSAGGSVPAAASPMALPPQHEGGTSAVDAFLRTHFSHDPIAKLLGRVYSKYFLLSEFCAVYFVLFCVVYHFLRRFDRFLLQASRHDFEDYGGKNKSKKANTEDEEITTALARAASSSSSASDSSTSSLASKLFLRLWVLKRVGFLLLALSVPTGAIYVAVKGCFVTGYELLKIGDPSRIKLTEDEALLVAKTDDDVALDGAYLLLGLAGLALVFAADFAGQQIYLAKVKQDRDEAMKKGLQQVRAFKKK
mmetsp:Transcript_21585/g.54511  ORF Transcript_21585/g.54511 Transcript_21585/m.54511 type:complete len:261 (+) Transcript_21585:171-953(+)|eukprot:CAMPEP_0179000206 /NCGR_PEP_ID=MMETSP0795-20121207/10523_1 /TAXON_ID=88552 /ORGANISM="Amoebophrya sp., Strain Ameob2" /LENGTH=260 /DNA_ID=CAMNT_0020693137 /DNA_START=146 /DNA_END=928 /DNA_ORIENTATION=-